MHIPCEEKPAAQANPQIPPQVLPWSARLIFCSLLLLTVSSIRAAETWVDVTSSLLERLTNNGAKPAWPGGCSGVVVNRLTGDVTIKVVGLGLWQSADTGQTWHRIDHDTISGRDETGWATSADQNAPNRMASFSLDGTAGWTTDGIHWKRFADMGRNWDYGSVDWAASKPQTIIVAKHETTPPGEVCLTTDGGVTWRKLAIYLQADRGQVSMVGALGQTTLIHSKGHGIFRSTDAGRTWIKVSSAQPQTRIPVLFRGRHYLGTAAGLLVSQDDGTTWQTQGEPVDIWQGPFFGRNEQEMVVVGKQGFFRTRNAGDTWTKVAELKANEKGFQFIPNWFGCYAWDPINNVLYASAMGNPVYKLDIGADEFTGKPSRSTALERVLVSPNGKGFVLANSKRQFRPWGVNYGNDGRLMEDFWDTDWKTLEDDFHEIQQMGGNTVRVHLQFGKFMEAPAKPNPAAFRQLERLLALAEATGLYLDLTGLACYRPADTPSWYDALDESGRWKAQAAFWRAVAARGASSPAVFCYDLMNEPISPAGPGSKWYSGKLFGDYDFVQYIARDPVGRTRTEIAIAWIDTMTKAIREKDPQGLVTVGLLPWVTGWKHLSGFIPKDIAPHLDFLSVHIYPKSEQPDEALRALQECDAGRPVVIEETFPLSCSVEELEAFLRESRKVACGWIWHYDGITLEEYDALEREQNLTIAQAIWRTALRSFIRLRPEFIGTEDSPPQAI